MKNYEYEQVALIESLANRLGIDMHQAEMVVLRKNLLSLTKRELKRIAVMDEVLKQIRIAQNAMDSEEELKLLRELAILEGL